MSVLCIFSKSILCVDPNIRTREERFTPLHFSARYIPRIIDRDVQLQENEGTSSAEVGKLSSSAQAMRHLVNLKQVKVSMMIVSVFFCTYVSRSVVIICMHSRIHGNQLRGSNIKIEIRSK